MKMAPQAQATSYLTAASLSANLGAGISPLIGGAFADYFNVRHLKVVVEWVDPIRTFDLPAFFLTGFDFLFAIAFVLGIITVGMLARVREEGEAQTEVVMNELMAQTRENLQVLNSVPGLSYVANFPVESLRRVSLLPGLDVALSVTAYQLASSVKMAMDTLIRGRYTAAQVHDRVGEAVEKASQKVEDMSRQGAQLAIGATRGALEAAGDSTLEVGRLTEEAVRGTLNALGKTAMNPVDALRSATYGAIQGAEEAGLLTGKVVAHIVKAARRAAAELGLSENEAETTAAQAAVEAASQFTKKIETEVKQAVLDELLSDSKTPPDSNTNAKEHA